MDKRLNNHRFRHIKFILIGIFFIRILNGQQQNLDYFLNLGLQNSPLLKDYSNRIKSGLIDSMRIKAGSGIRVNASSVNSYAPVIRGWGYDEVKTDIAALSAIVQISKEITWNKNQLNKYHAIRLQNKSALLEGSLSARDLKKTIISRYILAYGNQQYYKLNSEVLGVLREEEQIIKKLTENGFYRQTEYLSFVVNIRQQELVTEQFNFQFKADFETLNYLCGIFDTTRYALADPGLTSNPPTRIRNTLFFRQFIIDSLKLINSDRQIDFEYQPKLSLFGDGGYLSSLAVTPWKNFGISAGMTLTVPVYDGRQKQMQHNQVSIIESTRSSYQDFFESQYSQQIVLLEHQLSSIDQMAKKILEQQKYSRALIDANRVLLNSGDIAVSDYILSVNNYLNANNMLIENTIERWKIINDLNYWRE